MNLSLKTKDSPSEYPSSSDGILALDIGTEWVKALLALPGKSNTLNIVGTGKAKQLPDNMYSGAISDISGVISVCEQALMQAEDQAKITAKTVVVGIAGELIKGYTSTIRYRREQSSKPVTEAEMQQIIKKIQERAGAKARSELALETNNSNIEVRLINSALVSLQIDGYKVANPVGFKGSDILIQLYTAFAPLVHISAIEKVCAELNLDLLAVAVEPFAVSRACLGETNSQLSAIVMDVGGGTTDLALINNDGVEGTKMFGIGGRSFTHQIASKLGIEFSLAESLKLDPYSVAENLKPKLAQAISSSLEVWLSGVQLAVEEFNSKEVLPDQILLCGGGAGLIELQEVLATSDWYQNLNFNRRPLIQLVSPEDIEGINNTTNSLLDHSFITAFGLLRVALDTLAGSSEINPLRAKLRRLLQN